MKNVVVLLGDPRKYDPVKFGGRFNEEDFEVVNKLKGGLAEISEYNFIYLDDHDSLFDDLMTLKSSGRLDYVFNLCDEGFNNNPELESSIPDKLDELGIKYTGSSGKCLELCFNKKNVKKIANKIGVPIAKEYDLDDEIFFPVIVKPVKGDGGYGINKKNVVKNRGELEDVIRNLREMIGQNSEFLIEEFISGDELAQGVIGNVYDGFVILPLIKEDYSKLPSELPKICGYEAKWDPESVYWKCLSSISVKLERKISEMIKEFSLELFKLLGCNDYARFDWRLNGFGMPKLLEANPNPGWCDDGHLAKAAAIAEIPYSKMLEMILKTAEKRFGV